MALINEIEYWDELNQVWVIRLPVTYSYSDGRPRNEIRLKPKDMAYRLHNLGTPFHSIAKKLGVSESTARRWVKAWKQFEKEQRDKYPKTYAHHREPHS